MTQVETTGDPIQLLNTLKALAELRQSNIISDADYDRLKGHVLTTLERRITTEPAPDPQKAAPQLSQELQDYAGDLHRIITDKLSKMYPKDAVNGNISPEVYIEYMNVQVDTLTERRALFPNDRPYMTRVINTATDTSYAHSLARLTQAHREFSRIHNEVRLDTSSSPLAKAIAGISTDSAGKAVDAEMEASPAGGDNTSTEAQSRRSRWWKAVTADVSGAFTGAGTAAGILAIPGFPIASLAALGAIGPPAAVLPVFCAIAGAIMYSGPERASNRL